MKDAIETASELPFDEYMRHCTAFVNRRMREDDAFRAVIGNDPTDGMFLQALWARRYWERGSGS